MHPYKGPPSIGLLLFPTRILLFNNEPVFSQSMRRVLLVRDFLSCNFVNFEMVLTPNPHHLDDDLLLAFGR